MNIVPYDRGRHGAFVYTTFVDSLMGRREPQWPWCMMPEGHLRERITRALAHPDVRCHVAEGPEDAP